MPDSLERKYLDRTGAGAHTSNKLRIVGVGLMAAGGLCLIGGITGAFFLHPAMFLLCVPALPLLGFGAQLALFGFMGSILRFQAQQMAPVARDLTNYMAEGTQDGVRTSSRALATGLREGLAGAPLINMSSGAADDASMRCPTCGAGNQAGSKFCDQCSAALVLACPHCSASNQADSKFCDQCGSKLATT